MTRKLSSRPSAESAAKRAPLLKYNEACRLAEKNARTIAKVAQLMVSLEAD